MKAQLRLFKKFNDMPNNLIRLWIQNVHEEPFEKPGNQGSHSKTPARKELRNLKPKMLDITLKNLNYNLNLPDGW